MWLNWIQNCSSSAQWSINKKHQSREWMLTCWDSGVLLSDLLEDDITKRSFGGGFLGHECSEGLFVLLVDLRLTKITNFETATAKKRSPVLPWRLTKQGKSTHHAGVVLAQCVEAVELVDVLVVILAIDSRDVEGQGRRGRGSGGGVWCGSGGLKQGSQN